MEAANDNCDRVVTPFQVNNDRVGNLSSDAWLTPVNECEWGGIACWGSDTPNLDLRIDQLDFGKWFCLGRVLYSCLLDVLKFDFVAYLRVTTIINKRITVPWSMFQTKL